MPHVDILMATYNGEKYVEQQVESIIAQSHRDWTLVISDDGSSDHTTDLLKELEIRDPRIQVLAESNPLPGSAARNFSHLLRHTNAPYVMLCDQDDRWHRDKVSSTLQRMIDLKNECPGDNIPLLVFTDMVVIDENDEVISPSFEKFMHIDPTRLSFSAILTQPIGAGCTMMANKALVDLYNMAQPETQMLMHDWWLALVAAGFGKIVHLDSCTSDYRQHASNVVGATKHSVAQMVSNARVLSNDVWKTVDQARAFKATYEGLLPPNNQKILDAYCDLDNVKLSKRIKARRTSGSWKSGTARKVAELLVTVAGRGRSTGRTHDS